MHGSITIVHAAGELAYGFPVYLAASAAWRCCMMADERGADAAEAARVPASLASSVAVYAGGITHYRGYDSRRAFRLFWLAVVLPAGWLARLRKPFQFLRHYADISAFQAIASRF